MVASLPPYLNLRLSVLLYNIKSISRFDKKKEIIVKILKRIRFKNAVIKKVTVLTKENWQVLNFSKKINIRQLASRIGMENLEDLWELKKVLIKGSRSSERFKSVEIGRAENNLKETLQERPPVSLNDLVVKGKDLIELGYNEGKEIGISSTLYKWWTRGCNSNRKSDVDSFNLNNSEKRHITPLTRSEILSII